MNNGTKSGMALHCWIINGTFMAKLMWLARNDPLLEKLKRYFSVFSKVNQCSVSSGKTEVACQKSFTA